MNAKDLPILIASGQLSNSSEPPKPERRQVNCRNCGGNTHTVEIVDYEVITTCLHCGTTETVYEG